MNLGLMPNKLHKVVFLSLLFVASFFWFKIAGIRPIEKSDFAQDWAAASNLTQGLPIYGPRVFEHLGLPIQNYHPPFMAVLFLPLSIFELETAYWVWTGISLGLSLLYIFEVVKFMTPKSFYKYWFLMPLILFWSPFILHALWGQITIIMAWGVLLALKGIAKNKISITVIGIIMATLIKLYPIILLVGILNKFFKTTILAIVYLGFLTFGFLTVWGNSHLVLFFSAATENVEKFAYDSPNISLFALIIFFLSYSFSSLIPILFTYAIDKVILIVSLIWFKLQIYSDSVQAFLVMISVLVWVVPTSWTHNYILLLLCLIYLIKHKYSAHINWWLKMLIFILLVYPFNLFAILIQANPNIPKIIFFSLEKVPVFGTLALTYTLLRLPKLSSK